MTAVFGAWLAAVIPAASALAIWLMLGGHLYLPETLDLLLGHLLYGLLVGAIALFSASISESSATAAIVTLAFTIGSWVLDFALAGQPGVLGWVSRLSLTQTLRGFEQGLLSAGLVLVIAAATQIGTSVDLTEDRRNSFPAADQRALADLREPLIITVHLAAEDPRYVDLRRNILLKLERVMPRVTIRLATIGQSVVGSTSEEAYGEIEYSYGGRSDKSRSTSHREILPLIYALAGRQ